MFLYSCIKTQFYTIVYKGSLLHLSISFGVLGLKNVEDPWYRGYVL